MKVKKIINYKSIFVSDDQKDTMQFRVEGEYIEKDKIMIRFSHGDLHVQIAFKDKDIWLKNNDSLLHLNKDVMIENDYKVPYGSFILTTKVLMFEANEKHLKLKYELYQQDTLISTVYILIGMSDVEEEMPIS